MFFCRGAASSNKVMNLTQNARLHISIVMVIGFILSSALVAELSVAAEEKRPRTPVRAETASKLRDPLVAEGEYLAWVGDYIACHTRERAANRLRAVWRSTPLSV